MAVTVKHRVHAVLVAALAVSVACNVAAAEPSLIGRCVAAWPPIALMLVVDVLGRVPAGGGWLGRCQVAGAGLVALVAGIASFSHMRHVALTAGESELVGWLFPLTVDGLAVVASVALVEINRRSSSSVPESSEHSDRAEVPSLGPVPSASVNAAAGVPGPVASPVLNGHSPNADGVVWV